MWRCNADVCVKVSHWVAESCIRGIQCFSCLLWFGGLFRQTPSHLPFEPATCGYLVSWNLRTLDQLDSSCGHCDIVSTVTSLSAIEFSDCSCWVMLSSSAPVTMTGPPHFVDLHVNPGRLVFSLVLYLFLTTHATNQQVTLILPQGRRCFLLLVTICLLYNLLSHFPLLMPVVVTLITGMSNWVTGVPFAWFVCLFTCHMLACQCYASTRRKMLTIVKTLSPGESVSIQMLDGNETILRGPATITMVSQHAFPPVPMPVQVRIEHTC